MELNLTRHNTLKGEKHPQSKLTENEIRRIRASYYGGNYNQRELAEMFGVKRCTISGIVTRKTWRHVE